MKTLVFLLAMAAGLAGAAACSALDQDAIAAFQQPGLPPGLYQKVARGIPLNLRDVITLSRDGISPGAIVSYLYTYGAHFQLSMQDVEELKRERVSSDLIDYLTSPASHPGGPIF